MAQQTAIDYLVNLYYTKYDILLPSEDFAKAKAMEKEQRIQDYNTGFTDAQCNHVNDAENYANEIEYLKAKIDDIDNEIKRREDKIASLLINGTTNHDITDYTIGPFGTPENK